VSKPILNPEIIQRLREMELSGTLNTKEAARLYGVGTETIRRAVRGDTWRVIRSPVSPEQLEAASAASVRKLEELIVLEQKRRAIPEQILTELEGADVAKKRGYLD
jgi:transposase-like protein